jgi:hypothetical protein
MAQFGNRESLEEYAVRMNRESDEMTLIEKLLNPQRIEGGALDTAFNEAVMAEAAAELKRRKDDDAPA